MRKFLSIIAFAMLIVSCSGPMGAKISEQLADNDAVKLDPVEYEDFIYLTGAELHECIYDAVDDLKCEPDGELDAYDRECLSMCGKITYGDCHGFLKCMLEKGIDKAKRKLPEVGKLYENAMFEYAEEAISSRKEIQKCRKKWDPCAFVENCELAYYDTIVNVPEYTGKILADKRIRDFNGYIDTRMSEFSKEDLAAVVKKDAIASNLFPEITESNADKFAKDVAEYAASSDSGLPMYQWASVQHRKILYKVMSLVSVKNYGGDVHTMEALLDL